MRNHCANERFARRMQLSITSIQNQRRFAGDHIGKNSSFFFFLLGCICDAEKIYTFYSFFPKWSHLGKQNHISCVAKCVAAKCDNADNVLFGWLLSVMLN